MARLALLVLPLTGVALPPLGEARASAQVSTSDAAVPARLDELQVRLDAAQRQIERDHRDMVELRRQVDEMRTLMALRDSGMGGAERSRLSTPDHASAGEPSSDVTPDSSGDLAKAVAEIEERQAIQQAEIAVHEQSKVESASKYSLSLHGLVLFNGAAIDGAVDQASLPTLAIARTGYASHGSLTGTARQTLLGVRSAGPMVLGARTYADLEMDFAGGGASGGYTAGGSVFRLRTATIQMAWKKSAIEAGVSPLILTPGFATSYFSIAEPALSWSGAFWSWLPQISAEHTLELGESATLRLQGALIDVPDAQTNGRSGLGVVSAAERSRYPGSEARVAYERSGRRAGTIGAGGYWSPHRYASGTLDAWMGTIDWKIALPARMQWSGQVYRGAGLGGLNAGAYKDIVTAYPQADGLGIPEATMLRNAGGWTQLKYVAMTRLELNAALGVDDVDARQLRRADLDLTNPFSGLARNQTGFANVVFRPSLSVVLSAEYRRIHSWQIVGPFNRAQVFGLAAGYEF